ncbi:MAG: nitrite/sulfite reductase, partial [Chloroflexi bacterium]|nr:nitrite/sulfite reductase [Chloroflexota bacterium]
MSDPTLVTQPAAQDSNTRSEGHQNGRMLGVVQYLPEEINTFEEQVRRFLAGEVDAQEFRAVRLKLGVYGQRQPGVQMYRVKIPYGRLTPEGLEALGYVAEHHTLLKRGHVTTRENVQFHFTQLTDSAEIMRHLGEVGGLTSREACGNTVRNVTACPLAGICPTEVFDPTPYIAAYVRYFVRHPLTQNFPRKWKTAFSACDHDGAIVPMHDLGFYARVRQENGVQRKGFEMHIGGGTSVQPLLAKKLFDFVPVEDFLRVSEAAMRIFNRSDELRKNKMKARIKVLIDRIGIDEFRRQVEEELKGEWASRDDNLASLMQVDPEEAEAPPHPDHYTPVPSNDEAFGEWLASNAVAQKQPGYYAVYVKVPLGNVSAEQFHALADIARRYTSGYVRTTQRQNLLLRWVPAESLYDVYLALKAINLAEPGANEFTDVVSCPGTESCSLGITTSMGMGEMLWGYLKELGIKDPLVRQIRINISGCPDGCGQHHVGNIGFHGAAMKNESGQIPAYEVFVGGSQVAPVRYGAHLKVKVPARRVPEAIKLMVESYVAGRRDGEKFNDFVDRVGPNAFEQLLAPLAVLPKLGPDTIQYYMDWN